jgi:hypothetical protein
MKKMVEGATTTFKYPDELSRLAWAHVPLGIKSLEPGTNGEWHHETKFHCKGVLSDERMHLLMQFVYTIEDSKTVEWNLVDKDVLVRKETD